MAVEPEDDELLLDKEQDEGGDADEQDQEEQEQPSNEPGELGDDEGDEILIGDGAAPAPGERETPLAKHLREEIRRRDKEIAELRRNPPKPEIEVGTKPSLWEDCEGDEDKYDAALLAWNERKAQAAARETEADKQARAAQEAWQEDVQRFEGRKAELKVPGKEEAIETAIASLPMASRAAVLQAADNPALVLCALGQNPGKLAEFASIANPIKLAAAVAKLEGTLKVAPRRKAPEPEQIERGNASVRQGSDQTLARLQKQADRTGDRTDLIRYKNQQAARASK